MTTHSFRILNVFTHSNRTLSGNPLCVFENGAGFDTETMQALARQFNLSETTFLLPSTTADARVRIFTPAYEMPFAGHPTLGSAHVCRALGRGRDSLRLEMQAGIVPVAASGHRWTMTPPRPTWRELDTPLADLARALNLAVEDIGTRPLWVTAGSEQLIVPLNSEEAVRRAIPDPAKCAEIRNDVGAVLIYVFATRAPGGAGEALSRFFFSQSGAMLEDPATGSATANLGGWWIAMQRRLPLRLSISQGEMVARPSSLYLDVGIDDEIKVSGDVIQVGAGTVTLEPAG